jgi:hypothetical protein
MIAIMWQFDIKAGSEAEFEQFCGAGGEWTAANRHSRSFLGSSFLRGATSPETRTSRYMVVEYWSEMVVTEQHKTFHGDEIARLGARRDELAASFEPVGVFTALDVPDRTGPAWSRRN